MSDHRRVRRYKPKCADCQRCLSRIAVGLFQLSFGLEWLHVVAIVHR